MNEIVKTELWNGHNIRFVWHNNEWWAVGNDVAKALMYSRPHKAIADNCKGALTQDLLTNGGEQKAKIISEIDIYELIFVAAKQSANPAIKIKAEEFKNWVYGMLKELRLASGLEGFQIFRMLDKEHQKKMMNSLKNSLKQAVKIDYIKANTIANKATSTMFGYPKLVKKDKMTPEMLVKREEVLADTVELMTVIDKYDLECSTSEKIYKKYN